MSIYFKLDKCIYPDHYHHNQDIKFSRIFFPYLFCQFPKNLNSRHPFIFQLGGVNLPFPEKHVKKSYKLYNLFPASFIHFNVSEINLCSYVCLYWVSFYFSVLKYLYNHILFNHSLIDTYHFSFYILTNVNAVVMSI